VSAFRIRVDWRCGDKSGRYEATESFEPAPSGEVVDDAALYYNWEEGNYSCDCNRSRFFGLGSWPCGDTIEVTDIEITPLPDGA
jgi:hypothetical protein